MGQCKILKVLKVKYQASLRLVYANALEYHELVCPNAVFILFVSELKCSRQLPIAAKMYTLM